MLIGKRNKYMFKKLKIKLNIRFFIFFSFFAVFFLWSLHALIVLRIVENRMKNFRAENYFSHDYENLNDCDPMITPASRLKKR